MQTVLRQYFGHAEFRPGQQAVVDAILKGTDVLGIMPTGAGKSVCYQVPALLLEGLTIVISPLISLMKDQVDALAQNGISAACINSSLSQQQYGEVFRNAGRQAYRILYVAPERLLTNDFLALSRQVPIAMVTVDEAHCISQWGQDFRPSYLRIAQYIAGLARRPVVSAFTATATQAVRDDIVSLLQMRSPLRVTTGFDRPNLHFAVQQPDDKDRALAEILARHRGRSGIIYCATRKAVDEVHAALSRQRLLATRYHAGLDEKERQRNQDDFLFDRKLIMVATNAFGMGIDKSNVAFVVHYNMPKNVESYYQEAGRAGRDGEPAECTLLFDRQDIRTCRFLIERGSENQELGDVERQLVLARDLERLRTMTAYCQTSHCLRAFMMEYFGEKARPHCGACSSCQTEYEEIEITREARAIVGCVSQMAQRSLQFGKTILADVLIGSRNEKIRKFRLGDLPTHGRLAGLPRRRLDAIIDSLVEQECLRISDGRFPVVQLGAGADNLMEADARLVMRLAVEHPAPGRPQLQKPSAGRSAASLPPPSRTTRGKSGKTAAPQPFASLSAQSEGHPFSQPFTQPGISDPGFTGSGLGGPGRAAPDCHAGTGETGTVDIEELMALLKQVRRFVSTQERVPAYLIFSDHTLNDLCRKLPLTREAFLGVSGVGTVKADKYWLAFTTVIRTYMERQGCRLPQD